MTIASFDIKYFGTPLTTELTTSEAQNVNVGEVENVKTSYREGFFRRTLREMGETYQRYWDRIAETGVPARLQ